MMNNISDKQVAVFNAMSRFILPDIAFGTLIKDIIEYLNNNTGPQGIQGLTGPQGIQGLTGPQGIPGVDATPSNIITLTNKTGGVSIKGTVVSVSSTIDLSVTKIQQNIADPIGVIYEDGIEDGNEVKIVVSGIADVLFIGSTTRGHLARGFVTTDSNFIAGYALSEQFPSSPFASDKHFYEIGHVLQSRVGAGLAKVVLHFN